MSRIKTYLAAAGVFIAALFAAWFSGRRGGMSDAEAKAAQDRLNAMKAANNVRDEINDMGSDDRRDALAKWLRD